MHRCPCTGASCSAGANKPCGTGCTGGAKLMHRCKHHVMHQKACQVAWTKFFSTGWTGDTPESTGAIPKQLQGREAAPDEPVTRHRSIRWHHVSCQRPNGYPKTQSDRIHRCYTFGYSDVCAESCVTVLNGYFDLEDYIYATPPAIWSELEFKKVTNTTKNISKLSKSLALISLVLSTLWECCVEN